MSWQQLPILLVRKPSADQISSEPQAYYTAEEKLRRTSYTTTERVHNDLLNHKLPHYGH